MTILNGKNEDRHSALISAFYYLDTF